MGANEEYLDELLKSVMNSEANSKETSLDDLTSMLSELEGLDQDTDTGNANIDHSDNSELPMAEENQISEIEGVAQEETPEDPELSALTEENSVKSDLTALIEEDNSEESDLSALIEEDNSVDSELSELMVEDSPELEQSAPRESDNVDQEDDDTSRELEALLSQLQDTGEDDQDSDSDNSLDGTVDPEDQEDSADFAIEENRELEEIINVEEDSVDDMLALLESMSDQEDAADNENHSGDQQLTTGNAELEALLDAGKNGSGTMNKKEDRRAKREQKKKEKLEKRSQKKNNGTGEVQETGEEVKEQSDSSDNLEDAIVIDDLQDLELESLKPKKEFGFLNKLMAVFFTEEEIEDNKTSKNKKEPIDLADDNNAILAELDKEDKKKGKKKKGKKSTENKKGDAEDGEVEGEEDKKKEKKKKVKKVSEPDNSKKIPKKHIILTFAVCLSFFAVLLLLILFAPTVLNKSAARKDYYLKEYKDAYIEFYGYKLSESDELIFNRLDTILRLQRKYEAYLNYKKMGKEKESLDALLIGIEKYQLLADKATTLEVKNECDAIYAQILSALQEDFQLTEEDAMGFLAYKEPYIYSLKLEAFLNGTEFVNPLDVAIVPAESQPEEEILEDMLPEEEQIAVNETETNQEIATESNSETSTDPANTSVDEALPEETSGDRELFSGTVTGKDGSIVFGVE